MKTIFRMFVVLSSAILLSSCSGKQHKKRKISHYEQALVALEQGDTEQALATLDKAIDEKPLPHYCALKGTLLYQLHDFKGSKKQFKAILQQKTLSPLLKAEVLNNYACVLNQLGEREKADHIWQGLLKNSHYTTKEVAWFNRGMLALNDSKKLLTHNNKKLAKNAAKVAEQRFAHALNLEPNYVDALFFQSQALLQNEHEQQAIVNLKKVVALAPEHESAQQLLHTLEPKQHYL